VSQIREGITELKVENAEWQKYRIDMTHCNGLLESDIHDKKHIIIDLK
jgi:hypothetical protein